ncbi:MAG TPA: hypothetical protein VFH42_08720, partial [Sporolactobacillaceae bacterium]|nr:hypothetical protein [Sporolactobacillaceae bacterium]
LKSEILYNLNQVTSIMYREGVNLSPISNSSQAYDLGGLHPSIFYVNHNKSQCLYIYIFPSVKARQNLLNHLSQDPYTLTPFKTRKKPDQLAYIYKKFSSWNVLFLQVFPLSSVSAKNRKPTPSKLIDLEPIILRDLNGEKTQVYKAENADWKATFTDHFYEHWWNDHDGHLQHEINGTGECLATYKKQLPIKNVYISCQLPNQEQTNETPLLSNKTMRMTFEMTNLLNSYEPTMTFIWDGKASSLILHQNK